MTERKEGKQEEVEKERKRKDMKERKRMIR